MQGYHKRPVKASRFDRKTHYFGTLRRADFGAYEFGIGDYDCNRTVDLTDFANWQTCMTGPSTADTAVAPNRVTSAPRSDSPGSDSQSEIGNWESAIPCQAFDFNADGAIDLLDFAAFQPLLAGR